MTEVGLIRGLVNTKLITLGGLIGYFCISLPCAIILGFKFELGVYGLWTGLIFGSVFMCIYYKVLISYYFDWDVLSEKAMERNKLVEEYSKQKEINKIE
jgi:Na+-driven multidrug efflux pump